MNLKLAFSPCPNDTFIFDALVNGRIECGDLNFTTHIADVEALNREASLGMFDISKISIAAYPAMSDEYLLLDSGSALGNNNGPLLISAKKTPVKEVENLRIAIPGIHTTANLLLSIAFPKALDKKEIIFSEIENAVLHDIVDAGLIIHESRFTYKDRGLKKIIDLGEYWESNFHQLIPLGGIAIKRSLPKEIILKVNQLISQSVTYAFSNPLQSQDFIKMNAQEMADEVIKKHIQLYVNNYSVNMGTKGREAILFLFKKAKEYGILQNIPQNIFIE